jgi:hypothetical protein
MLDMASFLHIKGSEISGHLLTILIFVSIDIIFNDISSTISRSREPFFLGWGGWGVIFFCFVTVDKSSFPPDSIFSFRNFRQDDLIMSLPLV